jgi:hypothetical protein
MGYAAVIANIMEAHDCSEEEARTIFGQWGYEAVIANIMAKCNCKYEKAKSIFGKRGYNARIDNIIDTFGCSIKEAKRFIAQIGYEATIRKIMDENGISYDEAKSVLGRSGKAGVSEAQLAINGVKSTVTQLRNDQAAVEAKLIVFRGLDTFPGNGNRNLYLFEYNRRRKLNRAIEGIQKINSVDYNVGSKPTRTHAADLTFLETMLSELDDACNEVRCREASRLLG